MRARGVGTDMGHLRTALRSALVYFLFLVPVFAQDYDSTLKGQVVDESGFGVCSQTLRAPYFLSFLHGLSALNISWSFLKKMLALYKIVLTAKFWPV